MIRIVIGFLDQKHYQITLGVDVLSAVVSNRIVENVVYIMLYTGT